MELVVAGEHTSADKGALEAGSAGTLEERLGAFPLDDLSEGVSGIPVLGGRLTRGHYLHVSVHSVQGVWGQTGSHGDAPTEEVGGQKGVGEGASEEHGLERIVETKVDAAVDNGRAQARDVESVVETDRLEGLLADVKEAIELARLASLPGWHDVVNGKTSAGFVEWRHKEKLCGSASSSARCNVASEPLGPVAITLLIVNKINHDCKKKKILWSMNEFELTLLLWPSILLNWSLEANKTAWMGK